MQRILIASDLSERSLRALRRAIALARQFGSQLSVLHVADDDKPQALIDEECRQATAALESLLDEVGARHLSPSPAITAAPGDPFRLIVDEAARIGADLIVMGAHRKRLLGDVFTGTTIERVMRIGRRPVLMVNRNDEARYATVLAAVDLSDASSHALQTARDLRLLDSTRCVVVHGFLPLAEGMMYYAGIEQARIAEHVAVSADQARAAVNAFLSDAGFARMSDALLIEKGAPFEAIEAGIQHAQPELLVIGTHGYGGLKRMLLGSVADEVLRRVDCDVLAVPPPARP